MKQRKTISLSPQLWARLDSIAKANGVASISGPKAKQFSGVALIREIGEGKWNLTRRSDCPMEDKEA